MVAKQLMVAVAVVLFGVSWALSFRYLPSDVAQECFRNGGNETIDKVESAIQNLGPCYDTHANMANLVAGIEEAHWRKGSVNDVLKKYCAGKTRFLLCITDVTEAFKQCFKAGGRARENLDVARNFVDQLLEFICEQDGARSASLVAGGGLECVNQRETRVVLLTCLYNLKRVFLNDMFFEEALYINLDASTCNHVSTFQNCVVQDLMQCSQLIGDAAESLLQRLRLSTPCKNFPNSASGLAVTLLTSVMAATSLLV